MLVDWLAWKFALPTSVYDFQNEACIGMTKGLEEWGRIVLIHKHVGHVTNFYIRDVLGEHFREALPEELTLNSEHCWSSPCARDIIVVLRQQQVVYHLRDLQKEVTEYLIALKVIDN
ncbi:hypothetical protein PMAYCL1PPCAC_14507 [Pristionchus mayeri]|uniref:Uncharacterized protein n=1 Tax=Pristionchus mayeri TaxID=1317129 RepID=A0AAN5CH11_9BILA|nr:hypothetical protein PMAYCL1PPCAC_14507 [Pristionchus mayeri]